MDQGEVRVHNDMFSSGHWKWRRGHGRVLNIGVCWCSTKALKLISIQHPTKDTHVFHTRDDRIPTVAAAAEESLEKVTDTESF